jgi:hypothetical protein
MNGHEALKKEVKERLNKIRLDHFTERRRSSSKFTNRPVYMYKGNNNIWYEAREISELTGQTLQGVRDRFFKLGFESEYILYPPTEIGKTLSGICQASWFNNDAGNSAWRSLQD